MIKIISADEETQNANADLPIVLIKIKLMKKILIPTDFSDNAKNAADYGMTLFDSEATTFIFLNALFVPYSAGEIAYSYDDVSSKNSEQLFELEKKRIAKFFPNLKGKLENHFELGEVANIVSSYAKDNNIDNIVMGTKGASGLGEVLVGSRASSIIKKVDCPIVIVPENARFKKPEKILFTTDKELQEENLDIGILLEIAKKYDSAVHGLYVSKTGENMDVESTFIKYDLDLKMVDVKHDLDVDINKNTAEAIENYSKKYPTDLIAMVSTKGNLFHELFHKSVTKKVAMHTDIPMLIMHLNV